MKKSSAARRPVIIAIAGPNGAGKSTFFGAFFRDTGVRFVNADALSRELNIEAYRAAGVANAIRKELVARNQSFAFETVFSDTVGDKMEFLKAATAAGYDVTLCFIGVDSPEMSDQRVAMRVSQGGHDVPEDKIIARFPRTLANLKIALAELAHVVVYDNSDLAVPFRRIAEFRNGQQSFLAEALPGWFTRLL